MYRIFLLILTFLLLPSLCAAQTYKSAIKKATFLINAHRAQTQIPGCQVAVMVNGKLVWSQGFGYRNIETGALVDDSTKFKIASLSKPLTAVALGFLVDHDQLDLDKDIRQYLPEFPKKSYTITARQLAASTSGIRHYTSKDPTLNTQHYNTVFEAINPFKKDLLVFEPDTDYLYSSYGWVLLSAVMARASNTSFITLMQNTWRDLGMTHTAFDFPNKNVTHKSNFYVYDKKQIRKTAPQENRSYMYAGGGYLSTAEDLVKMGEQLINSDYLTEPTKNIFTTSHRLKNGQLTYYGLGWETGTSRMKTKIIYHSGSLPTSVAHLIIYPQKNVIFAYLANTGDRVFFNSREAQNIAELFFSDDQNSPTERKSITGQWTIETTSLRNKKSKGQLILERSSDGLITGTITFRRSRKIKTFPIIATSFNHNEIHCIAVSPMFIDFYLKIEASKFNGHWLHDFNEKGLPKEDPYWKARFISGSKLTSKKN